MCVRVLLATLLPRSLRDLCSTVVEARLYEDCLPFLMEMLIVKDSVRYIKFTDLPGIMVAHDWNGRDAFEDGVAEKLANWGIAAFAYDIYGETGTGPDHNTRLMKPFIEDRALLLRRVQDSFATFLNSTRRICWKKVHEREAFHFQLGIVGFCFGGFAVLDSVRHNLNGVKAAVTFHGSLDPIPSFSSHDPIEASILVLHGYADSSVTMDKVAALERELSDRRADWRVVVLGNGTQHAFSVPGSRFHEKSAQRAWTETHNFFIELFNIP